MGLKRKKATDVQGSEGEYMWTNLEPEDYDCRLAYVADLGLQCNEYKGEFKGNFQQISLGVEVIGEGCVDEDDVLQPRILWTKPFYIYDSLTEKGTELKYYKLFVADADEGDDPDWEAQLGKPVSVSVIQIKGKGENKDKVYDNIASLDKIPKKYQDDVGVAIAEVGIGDSDDPDNFVTKGLFGLPKFVFDKRITDEDGEADEPEQEEEKKAKKEPARAKKAAKSPAKKRAKASKRDEVEEEEEDNVDEDPFN